MTAPTTSPTTAPETPTLSEQIAHDPQFAMEETIRSTLAQSNDPESRPADRPRDATGKFVAQPATGQENGTPEVLPATPVGGEESTDQSEDVPVEIPEGYVAPPALPDEKAKAVGFTVRDTEGELVPPNLTWEFTANGKPRSVDTATLVQYAQHGVYNHEREQAYEQQQHQTLELQTRVQQYEQGYREQGQTIERLLSDPDYLVQQLQLYEQQNTPEARAMRAQQELEQQRNEVRLQQMGQQAEQFVNTELAPALDMIATNLSTVSREELAARLFLASQRYRVNGILTAEGFDPLKHYVLNDLVPWAKQLHDARLSERTAPADAAKATAEKAKKDAEQDRIRAQKARRQMTLATRPTGRAAPESQPAKPVRTNKDAEEAVIGNSLAALRAG
jgi:hypothetical protein